MKKHRHHDDDDYEGDYEPVFRHTAGIGKRLKSNLQQFALLILILGTAIFTAWMYAQ